MKKYSRNETGDRKTKRYLDDMPDLILAVFTQPGMTTRELCEAIGVNYERNGSKRCMYWFHNAAEFVQRVDSGPNNSYRWYPRRKWKKHRPRKVRRMWIEANPEINQ